MSGSDRSTSDWTARDLRRSLDVLDAGDTDALVLAKIAGRSPFELADSRRVRTMRALTAVAAGLFACLLVFSALPGGADDEERQEEPIPLLTLEEDGYGVYTSASVVLGELLTGEVPE